MATAAVGGGLSIAIAVLGDVVPPARGQTVDARTDYAVDAAARHAEEAAQHQRYQAQLAANNAAAERWKSTHRNDRPGRSTDEALVANNFSCPEGTQFWQRDLLTELCATPCTTDLDCAPEEGRCRVIDVFDEDKVPAAPLVDDTSPEEIEALLSDDSRSEPPLLLCDPFHDLTDIPDLELFEVVGAAAE